MIVLLLCAVIMILLTGCDAEEEKTAKKGTTRKKDYSESTNVTETVRDKDAHSGGFPKELAGTWKGKGTPKRDGAPIDLTVTIREDGTGEYVFLQGSYKECLPFSVDWSDGTFSVSTEETELGFASCGGTWELKNEKLYLDITTEFVSGRSYSYTAELKKQ